MRFEDPEEEAPLALERALKEVRAIYRQADAAYAPFSCPASGECCQLAVTKRPPWLWRVEWELLRRGRGVPPARSDGGCPYLDGAGLRCTAYADRPLGCRTFFCERIQGPAKQPRDLLNGLSKRMEVLSLRVSDEEPRPLPEWTVQPQRVTSRSGAPGAGSPSAAPPGRGSPGCAPPGSLPLPPARSPPATGSPVRSR